MSEDRQYQELRHGERLGGIPRRPWNDMLRLLKKDLGGGSPAAAQENAVQIRVRNATGGFLERFSVLAIVAPTVTYGNDPNLFLTRDLMEGTTPSVGTDFVITQQALDDGEIGLARLVGLARVKVDVTDITHQYASPVAGDTGQLESDTGGPAKILWVETDATTRATGVQWAVVLLSGTADASGGAGGGGTFSGAAVQYRNNISGSYTLLSGTAVDLPFNEVLYDTDSYFDSGDYSFNIPQDGYYEIGVTLLALANSNTPDTVSIVVYYHNSTPQVRHVLETTGIAPGNIAWYPAGFPYVYLGTVQLWLPAGFKCWVRVANGSDTYAGIFGKYHLADDTIDVPDWWIRRIDGVGSTGPAGPVGSAGANGATILSGSGPPT